MKLLQRLSLTIVTMLYITAVQIKTLKKTVTEINVRYFVLFSFHLKHLDSALD